MNDNLERTSKEAVVAFLRHYLYICMGWLKKTTKNLSRDGRSPGRDLNPSPPEYETGVLDTEVR
jgi:hypothetical protein